MGNGRIGLHQNPLRLAEVHQREIRVADVEQDLVDHGLYAAAGQQIFQIVLQKVRYTDDLNLSCRLCILQRTPNLLVFFKITLFHPKFIPRLRRVNDHLVEIGKPHLFQRFVNRLHRCVIGFQLCRHLAGDKQFFPRNAAGAHALSYAPFIAISLSGVNKAIAQLYRVSDSLRCLIVIDKPSAKTQLWDLHIVCQRVSLVQNHSSSSSFQMSFAMRKTAHALGQPQ